MATLRSRLNYFNRRKYERIDVKLPVSFHVDYPFYLKRLFDGREINAEAVDISEGGMCLISDYFIPKNTELLIRFSLSKVNKMGKVESFVPIELNAEVRNSAAVDADNYKIGIAFFKKTVEKKRDLSNFITASN